MRNDRMEMAYLIFFIYTIFKWIQKVRRKVNAFFAGYQLWKEKELNKRRLIFTTGGLGRRAV